MVSFELPVLLWGLLALPAAIALYVVAQRRRRARATAFASAAMMPNVVPRAPGWRYHVPAGLYLVALAAMLLGLARPHADVAGLRDRGAVILAMDSSNSMRGTDVAPTRLDAARRAAGEFLDLLPERFDVGLVTFDRSARSLSLPTTDRVALERALDGIETDPGTAIGDGIDRALEARTALADDPPPTAIVLLSDGNNTTGTDPLSAASAAADAGVPIHTIVLGRPDASPDVRPRPPDVGTLAAVADATGGRFLTTTTSDGLETIYGELATSIFEVTRQREVTDAFLGAAAVMLLAGAGSSLVFFNRFP